MSPPPPSAWELGQQDGWGPWGTGRVACDWPLRQAICHHGAKLVVTEEYVVLSEVAPALAPGLRGSPHLQTPACPRVFPGS